MRAEFFFILLLAVGCLCQTQTGTNQGQLPTTVPGQTPGVGQGINVPQIPGIGQGTNIPQIPGFGQGTNIPGLGQFQYPNGIPTIPGFGQFLGQAPSGGGGLGQLSQWMPGQAPSGGGGLGQLSQWIPPVALSGFQLGATAASPFIPRALSNLFGAS